jgi:signal transduction histidine kinase
VSQVAEDLMITPLKVWGRYSEAMFLSHHIVLDDGRLGIVPLPIGVEDQQAYVQTLSEKNRELADIRDALDHSNQELLQRNGELAELNQRLQEQSRLYQSLRINLDHLVELLKAGQTIGASLSVDQVHRAMVAAALRLFDVPTCRLILARNDDMEGVQIAQGMSPAWLALSVEPLAQELREAVCRTQEVRSLAFERDDDSAYHSVAMGPIMVRGRCLGTLEVYAQDARLDHSEVTTLLAYLCSEASIALDNAHLYHEVQVQGNQLRSFVDNVITTGEQESRRLALDLHDGLVQLVVASYQHLQTAQAGRARDPALEEREIEQGVQLLRRAIYEARRLISELRPAGLDDFGLVQALRLYVAQLAADADWQVTLEVDPEWTSLPLVLEAALFRIIQEATTNARKYAEARRVQIQLRTDAEQIGVIIRDWGKGFDLAEVSSAPEKGLHMGLVGIRERARLWGGQCLITTRPGKGTSIEVYIPRTRIRAQEEDAR